VLFSLLNFPTFDFKWLNPMRKVGLKDIAKEVGVSIALVSYVLNNKNENRIGKEVAAKIRSVAKKLDYQPNQIAKSLKSHKTATLGLILADISNPFSSQLARIIEDEAKKNGYTVIFGSSDENIEKSGNLINVLLNRQVDGIIIAAVDGAEEQLKQLNHKEVPFVLIDRYFPNKDYSYIAIDNYSASYDATKHLFENGWKNIGFLGYTTGLFHLQERKRGYVAAVKKYKKVVHKNYIHEIGLDHIEANVQEGIRKFLQLEPRVDAIFFTTNTLAVFGLKYLVSLNVNIPNDVAVVAFDHTDAYDLFYIPITHVKQPLEKIGQKATQALIEKINNPKANTTVLLNAELVVQASSLKKTFF
jgi:LacI family transcriptional regulator